MKAPPFDCFSGGTVQRLGQMPGGNEPDRALDVDHDDRAFLRLLTESLIAVRGQETNAKQPNKARRQDGKEPAMDRGAARVSKLSGSCHGATPGLTRPSHVVHS